MATRSYVLATGADYLKVSDDGGLTWETITPSGYPTNLSNITSIVSSPFNPNKAIITSSSEGLWITNDSGFSFSQVAGTGGLSFYSVSFIDAFKIVAVGSQVYRSLNGGTTFTLTGVTPASLYGSSGANIYFRNVHFGSPSIGFASIFDKVYKTYNSGISWEPTNNSAAVVSGKFVVGLLHLNDTNSVTTIVEDSGIYNSLDGGTTFVLETSTPVIDLNTSFLAKSGDSAGAWLIDSAQDIYYSTSTISGWTLVNTYPFATTLKQVVFGFSGTNAIFIGAGVSTVFTSIHTTQNGGATLNEEENYAGSAKALSSTYYYECGECPGKSNFNPQTGLCESIINAGPICPDGFTYDPVANTCVSDPTVVPRDIVIARDNSGSVNNYPGQNCVSTPSNNEWGQMNVLLSDFTTGLSAELSAGTVQIGIVDWGAGSSLRLGLTGAEGTIISNICVDSNGGGTNTVSGLCGAYNELINGATENPSATKVLLLVTDGNPSAGSNTACAALPFVSTGSSINNARLLAQNIRAQGVKIIVVGLGTSDDRADVFGSLVQPAGALFGSETLTSPPVPSLDSNGNLLYFESDFNSAAQLVQSILDGISTQEIIPAPTCEECTIYISPIDDTAYFQSTLKYDFIPCCYKLSSCNSATEIYSTSDLSQYDGQVVNIAGQDGCFSIEQLNSVCSENAQSVTVTTVYGSCEVCLPSYKLFNCKDSNVAIQTASTQFEALLGKTVNLVEYPGDCWQVGPNNEKTLPLVPLTLDGQPFETCEECDPKEYGLTNCVNGVSILSTVDLSAYVGKVIKADNFPGLCFTVEDNPCDCLQVTLNGQVYTVDKEENLFNGRPYFQFITANELPIVIAYDSAESRWEIYNPDTQAIYFYSYMDIECPSTSVWEKQDPNFPGNVTTETCPLTILNISPTEEFASCEPCVNC